MKSISFLVFLPGPLWHKVVEDAIVQSMGKIDLLEINGIR